MQFELKLGETTVIQTCRQRFAFFTDASYKVQFNLTYCSIRNRELELTNPISLNVKIAFVIPELLQPEGSEWNVSRHGSRASAAMGSSSQINFNKFRI
ncbi:hypothetical protein TNCV_3456851 [Trichonephila clavipes]|nr:hypothetical protein TNCV_3456851 [Trichonephila clavipes]